MAKAKAKSKTSKPSAKRPAARGATSATKSTSARPRTAPRGASRTTSRSRKPGKAAVGKSGALPEVGTARVEATPALGTRPTATRKPAGRAAAQLPGEKVVGPTDQTFPVKAERSAPGDRQPVSEAAVDRRRQIVGTDDPGVKSRG